MFRAGLLCGFALRLLLALRLRPVFRRIKLRVRYRHHGFRVSEEFLDERVELLHAGRLARGEVVLFAEIIAEVKEQVAMRAVLAAVEDADELPVTAVRDDSGW